MRSIKHTIRATLLVCGSLLVALGYPLSALADEIPATVTDPPATSAPTEESVPAEASPTEAGGAFSAPTTPEPSTEAPVPAPEPPKLAYSYDASTGRWNSNEWTYNPTSGKYEKTIQPVAAPVTITPEKGDTNSLGLDSSTTNAIATALSATASTGDASVLSNTAAGNATTGNASSVATIVNNVNSSMASNSNQQAAQFVSNVMGDVNGDIMLQPMLLKAMLEAAAQKPTDATVKATTDTAITNDISLSAKSGDATVAKNGSAGDATSGNANTVANVLNIVNSMIAANQSFIGTINIYGNLNGDILIAPDFIPNLLASNGESGEASKAVGTASITSDNNTSVVNNIALAAKTGEALVSGNTAAGSATSGTATTNTVIFNLTNHEVVASNSLLVFVNVLGRWVGVIVDAPAGATAAAIGDNVTQNKLTPTPNLVIDAVNTTAITNNIDLSSVSGNATVARNTLGGNALTGNATASANVANIVGNNIGLSGWFGVLYINVFGSWVGSFGLDTSAGNPVIAMPSQNTTTSAEPLHVIQFIPRAGVQAVRAAVIQTGSIVSLASQSQPETETSAVSGVMTENNDTFQPAAAANIAPIDNLNLPMVFGSLLLAAGSLYGLRRLVASDGSAKHIVQ